MNGPAKPSNREFNAFYEAHVGFVWRVLVRFGIDGDATRDATQEVFVTAYKKFGVWEGRASAQTWLFGTARRVAARHRRTDSRRQRKHAELQAPGSVDLGARVEHRSRLRQIASLLEGLASDRRMVFELAVIEGMPPQEIADALGWKLNTVYSRLRRARDEVERELAKLDAEPAEPPMHPRRRHG